jgi:hypothetical protein
MRNAAVIIPLALLLGACVTVAQIQQTQPIRTLQFTGSHDTVAKCVHQRLGGKMQNEFGERYVIYDSAKAHEREGLTHYAVTVGRVSADKGFAEWRIMRPARQAGPGTQGRPLSRAMVDQYWQPVQDCAAKGEGPL